MDPYARLRSQIRAGRELLNMKQADVAGILNISLSKLSRAESGETKSGDILLDIQRGLERMGVTFTKGGVEVSHNQVYIIEGADWFVKLMDDVLLTLQNSENPELLIECADERQSSSEVNDRMRKARSQNIRMRALVEEGNTHLMGRLSEYRYIPKDRFVNDVSLIYGDKFAICTNNNTQAVVFRDAILAMTRRNIFNLLWDVLKQPTLSTAHEKY
jgi:transcriptional regulator with XRE-family HTH domain